MPFHIPCPMAEHLYTSSYLGLCLQRVATGEVVKSHPKFSTFSKS